MDKGKNKVYDDIMEAINVFETYAKKLPEGYTAKGTWQPQEQNGSAVENPTKQKTESAIPESPETKSTTSNEIKNKLVLSMAFLGILLINILVPTARAASLPLLFSFITWTYLKWAISSKIDNKYAKEVVEWVVKYIGAAMIGFAFVSISAAILAICKGLVVDTKLVALENTVQEFGNNLKLISDPGILISTFLGIGLILLQLYYRQISLFTKYEALQGYLEQASIALFVITAFTFSIQSVIGEFQFDKKTKNEAYKELVAALKRKEEVEAQYKILNEAILPLIKSSQRENFPEVRQQLISDPALRSISNMHAAFQVEAIRLLAEQFVQQKVKISNFNCNTANSEASLRNVSDVNRKQSKAYTNTKSRIKYDPSLPFTTKQEIEAVNDEIESIVKETSVIEADLSKLLKSTVGKLLGTSVPGFENALKPLEDFLKKMIEIGANYIFDEAKFKGISAEEILGSLYSKMAKAISIKADKPIISPSPVAQQAKIEQSVAVANLPYNDNAIDLWRGAIADAELGHRYSKDSKKQGFNPLLSDDELERNLRFINEERRLNGLLKQFGYLYNIDGRTAGQEKQINEIVSAYLHINNRRVNPKTSYFEDALQRRNSLLSIVPEGTFSSRPLETNFIDPYRGFMNHPPYTYRPYHSTYMHRLYINPYVRTQPRGFWANIARAARYIRR